MTSRLVLESWQTNLPAVGFVIFLTVFLGVVVRVWRTKRSSLNRVERLPLEPEALRPASHVRTQSR